MKIRGIGRLQIIARTVQNRIGANALILLYHRISEGAPDPQRLAVSPVHFSEHLRVLTRLTDPVALEELPVQLKRRSRNARPLSAITFDDGYADNLDPAARILEEQGVPATVFVTTTAREFYWDALERLLLRPSLPDALTLEIDGQTHTWSFAGKPMDDAPWDIRQPPRCEAQRAYLELSELFRNLHPDKRESVLDQLFKWADICRQPQNRKHRCLAENELRQLASKKLITIGAHTVNHPVLFALKPDEQAREIMAGRIQLERIAGRPVRAFSYPYGCERDYSRQTVKMVRAAGFTCACANIPRLINRWTDPLQLPRIIAEDVDGETFEKRIGLYLQPHNSYWKQQMISAQNNQGLLGTQLS